MKKTVIALLLLPALYLSAHAQSLTSADQVIDKYINALGGKTALMKIKDLSFQSTVFHASGTNPLLVKYKMPFKALYVSTDAKGKVIYKQTIDGQQVSTLYDGKTTPASAAETERTILTAQLVPELYLAQKGVKSALTGMETIKGKKAYKVVYTMARSSWMSYYDAQTGLKIKSEFPGQSGLPATTYTDYREVNGVKLPHRFISSESDVKVSKYQMNTGLNDAQFVIK